MTDASYDEVVNLRFRVEVEDRIDKEGERAKEIRRERVEWGCGFI